MDAEDASTATHGLEQQQVPDEKPARKVTKVRASRAKGTPRIPMRIARIETVPMTPEEFDKAVKALAVLLNVYWRSHPESS
jgi:hypothetical protein